MPDQENYNAWLDNIYQPTAKNTLNAKQNSKPHLGSPYPRLFLQSKLIRTGLIC